MWILTMFDLPVDTRVARRSYARFRKLLLKDGFLQMQFSVYARCCPSEENVAVHLQRVSTHLPPDGEVRMLTITDKQFERMRIYWGKMRQRPESAPQQLEMF